MYEFLDFCTRKQLFLQCGICNSPNIWLFPLLQCQISNNLHIDIRHVLSLWKFMELSSLYAIKDCSEGTQLPYEHYISNNKRCAYLCPQNPPSSPLAGFYAFFSQPLPWIPWMSSHPCCTQAADHDSWLELPVFRANHIL